MFMNKWREYLTTLLLAVLCAVIVRNYFITAYKVPTGSMQPTLKPGDFIFSSRLAYKFNLPLIGTLFPQTAPQRGDLVVFTYPDMRTVNYVKRVIAIAGDKVEIEDGKILLNDEPLRYVKGEGNIADNPNPELFEIFEEHLGDLSWRVIFQKSGRKENFGPIVVPPGEVFLLGDNRDASDDSRYWGTVSEAELRGRVFFIWFSLDSKRRWMNNSYPSVRWERVFSSVH